MKESSDILQILHFFHYLVH